MWWAGRLSGEEGDHERQGARVLACCLDDRVHGARHVPGERQEAGRRGCQAEGQEDEGRSFGKYIVRRPEHHTCALTLARMHVRACHLGCREAGRA